LVDEHNPALADAAGKGVSLGRTLVAGRTFVLTC